jgi:hypothetical protein
MSASPAPSLSGRPEDRRGGPSGSGSCPALSPGPDSAPGRFPETPGPRKTGGHSEAREAWESPVRGPGAAPRARLSLLAATGFHPRPEDRPRSADPCPGDRNLRGTEELHPCGRCRPPRGGSSSPRRGMPERGPFAFSIPSPLMSASRASCGGRGGRAGAFLRPPTPPPAHPRGFRGGFPGKQPGSGLPALTAGWTRAGRPSIPWLCGEFLREMARMISDLRENSPETPRPKTPGLGRGRSGPGRSAIPWGQDRGAIAQSHRVPSLASLAPRPSRPRVLLLTLLLGGGSALRFYRPPCRGGFEPISRIRGPAMVLLTEPPGETRARPLSPRPLPPDPCGREYRY